MTPIDWAKRPIEKYADFSGRAGRPEYWWFVLALVVAYLVVSIVESMVGIDKSVGPYGPISLLLMVGTLLPSLAAGARRLHDTNRTGWWLLIAMVPYAILALVGIMAMAGAGALGLVAMVGMLGIVALIGAVVLLIFMVLPGTPGVNLYGPDPRVGQPAATTA